MPDRRLISGIPTLMAKRSLRWLVVFGFAFATVAGAGAGVPTRYEQFIYSVVAFNGRDYSATFVRQPAKTAYLVANHDSFLQALDTFVYFWPITGTYRLDTSILDHQFNGKLEVTGNGISRTLSMQRYTYYNLHGEYGFNWRVAKGPAAEKAYNHYQQLVDSYEQKMYVYQNALAAYQRKQTELAGKMSAVRNRGGDVSSLLNEFRSLKPPQAPTPPSAYLAPPIQPEKAFVVNLPVGMYQIELINPNGTIMQGSQKRLVVFSRHGAEKVGYDVIPADKWTRPESSAVPGSVLYVDGSTDLYLRPFYEARYNELYHKKLENNDARGNPNMSEWVTLRQVRHAKITLEYSAADRKSVRQEPFGVRQIQGASLGYKIVPWSEYHHQPGAKPDVVAYHVPIQPQDRVIHIVSYADNGDALPGGERQIRVVSGSTSQAVLFILALVPLGVAGVVIGMRARRYVN